MSQSLPEFTNPPVAEVALSAQFERLASPSARLGLVWTKFRDRFPDIQEQPELEPAIERFDVAQRQVPMIQLEMKSEHSPRLWFVSKDDGDELVQIQRDRFVRNWRKTEGASEYPRYTNLRSAFIDDWSIFFSFVQEEIQETLTPNQCEVTYVNIIEDAKGIDQVLAFVDEMSTDQLGYPEEAVMQFRYLLRGDDGEPYGRLNVACVPANRKSDGKPVIRLSLTARGAPTQPDLEGVLGFFDKGHAAVVQGFASLTSQEMHKIWGRTK